MKISGHYGYLTRPSSRWPFRQNTTKYSHKNVFLFVLRFLLVFRIIDNNVSAMGNIYRTQKRRRRRLFEIFYKDGDKQEREDGQGWEATTSVLLTSTSLLADVVLDRAGESEGVEIETDKQSSHQEVPDNHDDRTETSVNQDIPTRVESRSRDHGLAEPGGDRSDSVLLGSDTEPGLVDLSLPGELFEEILWEGSLSVEQSERRTEALTNENKTGSVSANESSCFEPGMLENYSDLVDSLLASATPDDLLQKISINTELSGEEFNVTAAENMELNTSASENTEEINVPERSGGKRGRGKENTIGEPRKKSPRQEIVRSAPIITEKSKIHKTILAAKPKQNNRKSKISRKHLAARNVRTLGTSKNPAGTIKNPAGAAKTQTGTAKTSFCSRHGLEERQTVGQPTGRELRLFRARERRHDLRCRELGDRSGGELAGLRRTRVKRGSLGWQLHMEIDNMMELKMNDEDMENSDEELAENTKESKEIKTSQNKRQKLNFRKHPSLHPSTSLSVTRHDILSDPEEENEEEVDDVEEGREAEEVEEIIEPSTEPLSMPLLF